MSLYWLKNLAGGQLSDDEMKNIPNPTLELGIHVTMKDVQAFSILGMVIIGPAVALIRKKPLMKTMFTSSKYGAVLGLGAGPLMTYGKVRGTDEERIYDRCYRLRYNRGQVRVDQLSILGGVVGVGSALLMGNGNRMMGGGVLGIVAGTVAGGVFNNFILKKK